MTWDETWTRDGENRLAPTKVGAIEAAATTLAARTAWQALIDHGHLEPGQHVLVHGGAGGVGIFTVQLARHFGAEVTATARKADTEFLEGLGADHVIDFDTTDFESAGRMFDLVIDPIGGETMHRSYAVTRRGGKLITLNGPPPDLDRTNLTQLRHSPGRSAPRPALQQRSRYSSG